MKDNTMAPQTTFKQLELSQLRANKSNIRTELTDIEELADSIKAQGLLQPLLVTPHPEVEGDYLVIGGHRRLAASTAAGLLTVPCMVAEGFESLPGAAADSVAPVEDEVNFQWPVMCIGLLPAKISPLIPAGS